MRRGGGAILLRKFEGEKMMSVSVLARTGVLVRTLSHTFEIHNLPQNGATACGDITHNQSHDRACSCAHCFTLLQIFKLMKSTILLALWFGTVVRGAASFAPANHHFSPTIKQNRQQAYSKQLTTSLNIRGGGMGSSLPVLGPAADAISSSLVSGSPLRAIGGMWAISSLVIVPLTYIRQGYSFSVGYGFSVAAMVSMSFCVLVSCNDDGKSPHLCLLIRVTSD